MINFPINSDSSYDFIWEHTLDYTFLIWELESLENWNSINLKFWNLINNLTDSFDENLHDDIDEEIEEDILELFDSIANEDIEEKLEEYKWKKDLIQIKNLIKYFKSIKLNELYHIMDAIYNDEFKKKDLIIYDKSLNQWLKYILSEYTSLTKWLSTDSDLKKLLINDPTDESLASIIEIFISYFKELELQIGWYNEIKDDIIKSVYLAKNWDIKAREYIIGTIIQKEAKKMAGKYSIRNGIRDQELFDDLLQEAILSSITWLNKYNFKKNDNFIFYIRFWIKQWIHRWLENQYNEIKIPSHIIQMFSKIKNLQNSWESTVLEIEEIVVELIKQHVQKIDWKIKVLKSELKNKKGRAAEKLKWEIKLLKEMTIDEYFKDNIRKKVKNTIEKITSNSVSSIWTLLKNLDDDEWYGLEANILIDENADIVKQLHNTEKSEAIKQLLDVVLTKEEKTVIIHRFGLFWADTLLLETLWKKINKSAERVRQVFKNATNKLSIRSFDEATAGLSANKKILERK